MDEAPGAWEVVKWLSAGMVGILTWYARGHEERLRKLEERHVSKDEVEKQRLELKAAITDIHDELGDFRREFKETNLRVTDRLQELADRLPRVDGR